MKAKWENPPHDRSASKLFNIADFVEYLWDIDNSGVKLLQVRFYPADAVVDAAPSRHSTLTTQWGRIRSQ